MLDTAIPGVNRLFVAGFNYNEVLNGGNDMLLTVIETALKEILFERVTENTFYRGLVLRLCFN